MKTKVALKLNELNPAETVSFAKSVVTHMTGNSYFNTPSPTLSSVSDKATETETAIANASTGGKEFTLIRNQKLAELLNLLIALGYYVEVTADGDETIILSAGMSVRKTRTPAGVPPIPAGLSVQKSATKGHAVVFWDATTNAHMYILQRNDDASFSNTAWILVKVLSQTSMDVDGIDLSKPSAFRVCAVGTAGESAFSAEVYSPEW